MNLKDKSDPSDSSKGNEDTTGTDVSVVNSAPRNLTTYNQSGELVNNDFSGIRWPSSAWRDGTRRSAFQPYRPITVLTNLQRGNTSTQTDQSDGQEFSWFERSGRGDITLQHIQQCRNVDIIDDNGLTALMWASAYGQNPTVQMLLSAGARVDHWGPQGETALLLAAANGHIDIVKVLISSGADVNHSDALGNTALMYAAYGDHPHCANELLNHGANVMAENANAETAFTICTRVDSIQAQAVIESHLLISLTGN